jgi:hypothetical protein
MDQATINRYQAVNPDTGQQGDIYASLLAEHGQSCADACAAAALTGDETQINAALAGNTILSFLKNPWVVAIVVGYLFFFMGGGGMLKGILNKKGGAK